MSRNTRPKKTQGRLALYSLTYSISWSNSDVHVAHVALTDPSLNTALYFHSLTTSQLAFHDEVTEEKSQRRMRENCFLIQ